MKRNDIDKIFTEHVSAYIMDGWTINTNSMTGHQGEEGKVDLIKGDELIRIWLSKESCSNWSDDYKNKFHGYKMVLRIGRWNRPARESIDSWTTVWMKDLDVIMEKNFYDMNNRGNRNWYTEEYDEALAAQTLRWDRYRYHQYVGVSSIITSQDNIEIAVKYLKNHAGYSRVSRDKVDIRKSISRDRQHAAYYVIYNSNSYLLK